LRFVFQGKLELGTRMETRFAKTTAGITAFIVETKGFPQREAEGPRPRLDPWQGHLLVVSRSAALPPRPGGDLEIIASPISFEKRRAARFLILEFPEF
jgi:hypothetical protein